MDVQGDFCLRFAFLHMHTDRVVWAWDRNPRTARGRGRGGGGPGEEEAEARGGGGGGPGEEEAGARGGGGGSPGEGKAGVRGGEAGPRAAVLISRKHGAVPGTSGHIRRTWTDAPAHSASLSAPASH